jgi:hypothetical protein
MTGKASMVHISAILENALGMNRDTKDRRGMDMEGKGKVGRMGRLEGVLVAVVCTSDKLEGVSWGISDISGKMLEGMLGHHLH